jgi:hypothetical protein
LTADSTFEPQTKLENKNTYPVNKITGIVSAHFGFFDKKCSENEDSKGEDFRFYCFHSTSPK